MVVINYYSGNIYKDEYIYFLKAHYPLIYKALSKDNEFIVKQYVYIYLYKNKYMNNKAYTKLLEDNDKHFIYFEVDFKKLFEREPYLYCYFSLFFDGDKFNAFNKLFGKFAPLEYAA